MMGDGVTALCAVLFPGCEPFLADYLRSIREQTDQNFSIMLLNDGVKGADTKVIENLIGFGLEILSGAGSPANNRVKLINRCIDAGFKKIIFSDVDDVMAPNRAEVVNSLLERHDLVVNDLHLISENGEVIRPEVVSSRLGNQRAFEFEDLVEKNFCGMTNMSFCAPISGEIRVPRHAVAVDWLIASQLLLNGRQGLFTSSTTTGYRQHSGNVAGIGASHNLVKIDKVRKAHFEFLRARYPRDERVQIASARERQRASDLVGATVCLEDKNKLWWER